MDIPTVIMLSMIVLLLLFQRWADKQAVIRWPPDYKKHGLKPKAIMHSISIWPHGTTYYHADGSKSIIDDDGQRIYLTEEK
jgi:hypothetical protein